MNTTALLELPIGAIKPHPKNVRHAAVADPEMVESIRANGLLQPLVVVRESDSDLSDYLLIAGHRRLDGLRKAGITKVPALVRDDLLTEAQQIEAMLIENGRRVDLTPVEEAEGYEQLELFGYKPKDIAKATGRSVATVKERLRLKELSSKAKAKLHDGQITLADAEALMEFADDHEQYADAEAALGTTDFRWKVQEIRNRRQKTADNKELLAELTETGAAVLEERPNFDHTEGPCPLNWFGWTSPAKERSAHDSDCLAYVPPADPWGMVLIVCTNPQRHAEAKPDADPETEEQQAERAAQLAAAEEARIAHQAAVAAARAARQVRTHWLVEHLTELLAPINKGAAGNLLASFAHAAAPALITDHGLMEAIDPAFIANLIGTDLDEELSGGYGSWSKAVQAVQVHADGIELGSQKDAVAELVNWLAVVVNHLLEVDAEDATEARRVLNLWDWVRLAGYPLPKPDVAHVARLEEIIDEAQAAAEDGAA